VLIFFGTQPVVADLQEVALEEDRQPLVYQAALFGVGGSDEDETLTQIIVEVPVDESLLERLKISPLIRFGRIGPVRER